ncbi:hypothetical protein [Deinococcus cellulosilyticus]|uniref:Uncharacterized protein n=1 Tax=Deinococcus cellulosilyticus (strain DSM 18568 / NBRC 106333 / KACC 11606 / 5516J-15) TaxID=1223518 RepID=A0A511NBF8_DEIC1|nr:hypothetical protein [Deinococcus cellulosilyticus]GEM50155.1 hypothetical protein DC3_57900 [Deinococcus cellulosilyticus NBRC 106333 = KACC 11606]
MSDQPTPDDQEQPKRKRKKGGGRKRQASAPATPENQFMTYQPQIIREAVAAYTVKTGKSKSRIVEEALRAYLDLPPLPENPNEYPESP